MSANATHDVAVIGAGPIGLATACLLSDHGLNVVVLEQNPGLMDLPRAISVTDESLRVMDELGLLERFEGDVLLDTGARYWGRNGQLLAETKPRPSRHGLAGKSQFDQPVMEEVLLQGAQERNIDLRFNTEVTGFQHAPDLVTVKLHGPDGDGEIRTPWVLACDGGKSPSRERLGIPLDGSTQVEKWIVLDIIDSEEEVEMFADFHCNGTRPVVIVPGVKGRRRYEFMLLPEDNEATVAEPESIVKLVAPYETVRPEQIRRAAVYTAHQRIAAEYRRGRVVLVGDAAHLMPPFAGQALNAGMRDAANIAWKIAAVTRGEALETIVDTYEAERRPHAKQMVDLSHRIGQVVMSTSPVVTAIRDVAVKASGVAPRLKRYLTEMRFLAQPQFSVGVVAPAAKDLPKAVAELVGKPVPQPVVKHDGEGAPSGVRLDRVLGIGWAEVRAVGPNTLEITPVGRDGEAVTVTREDDLLGELVPGVTLLVRPDRYVAAAYTSAGKRDALRRAAKDIPALLEWTRTADLA